MQKGFVSLRDYLYQGEKKGRDYDDYKKCEGYEKYEDKCYESSCWYDKPWYHKPEKKCSGCNVFVNTFCHEEKKCPEPKPHKDSDGCNIFITIQCGDKEKKIDCGKYWD